MISRELLEQAIWELERTIRLLQEGVPDYPALDDLRDLLFKLKGELENEDV